MSDFPNENVEGAASASPPFRLDLDSDLAERARRLDRCNMAEVIRRLPAQIEIALGDSIGPLPGGSFERVIVVGMGGSALPVDVVLDAFADRQKLPIHIVRHYELPDFVNERTLIVASSFSGGTEEVLAAIENLPNNANVVALSSGGRLATLAEARGYTLIRIPLHNEPPGFQPRSAVGYTATYLARVFHAAEALADSRPELSTVPAFLRRHSTRDDARRTAVWLADRIPVIYTDEQHLLGIARPAKIKFNENAKRPAFFNAFPELNHNEMIGFRTKLARFAVLYFDDPASHPRIRRRFEVMRTTFAARGMDHVDFREWRIPGATRAEKVFAALEFADWCSYYRALLDGLDPTPVDLVEEFKALLTAS
ncbi:MAG TPA: SIS domain-containing protein [Phycisphaerae bacterium]|nr:SIS domain-containing protein [Phycisphaerae bacterium]